MSFVDPLFACDSESEAPIFQHTRDMVLDQANSDTFYPSPSFPDPVSSCGSTVRYGVKRFKHCSTKLFVTMLIASEKIRHVFVTNR